ncbi:flagellar assembly protein FlgT [Shewanella waksmanii]|uniref:flagellar assembly protein FlgT n=1 Tax=Shewanella waksmanii TaxID=213783 RepID=UPI0004901050|nr:flagellar assembly protein FlgT [Shewanella waksmanii]
MNRLIWGVLLILSGSLMPTFAAWVDVQGEAKIINNNVTQAREEAIHQALSYVSLRSGGSFSSSQRIENGRLVKDQFSMDQSINITQVELVSERVVGDRLMVNIRADVNNGASSLCTNESLKASILVPQAQLHHREQLRYGNIGHFERHLSERLGQVIERHGKASFPHVHASERLDIEQALIDIRGYRLPTWLSEITDSQYLLLPEIIDISTAPPETSLFGMISDDPQRQFQLKLSLYHGISGEMIWSELYNSPAPWEFKKQLTVPSNSNIFWSSSYGKNIENILVQASEDIDKILNCRPLLGQIVAKQHDRIIINLGRRHGIKVGDEFQLVLQQNMPDRLDKMRAIAGQSRTSISIDQVTEESATALLQGQNASLNIQINDLAIKQ